MNGLEAKICDLFPGVQPAWNVTLGGTLRIFLPHETSLGQVLSLRRWLLEQRAMGPDNGFSIKQDGDSAILTGYLDLEAVS